MTKDLTIHQFTRAGLWERNETEMMTSLIEFLADSRRTECQ
jgi:hypothetical protein